MLIVCQKNSDVFDWTAAVVALRCQNINQSEVRCGFESAPQAILNAIWME